MRAEVVAWVERFVEAVVADVDVDVVVVVVVVCVCACACVRECVCMCVRERRIGICNLTAPRQSSSATMMSTLFSFIVSTILATGSWSSRIMMNASQSMNST
jgi:hypothetical protein